MHAFKSLYCSDMNISRPDIDPIAYEMVDKQEIKWLEFFFKKVNKRL